MLFGIFDPETEFSITKPMRLFLSKNLTWNTALDQSGTMPQNGLIGPGNYPYPALSFRIREHFTEKFSGALLIANAASNNPNNPQQNNIKFSSDYGALSIAELDYSPIKTSKLMLGVWGLSSKLHANLPNDDGSIRNIRGQEGAYLGATKRLYSQDETRGLDGFFTLGYSNPEASNVDVSLNGGVAYKGILESRPKDNLAFSVNVNHAPSSYREAAEINHSPINTYETSFELTYKAKMNDWLILQPNIQYIIDPNYDPNLKNDWLVGLHFEFGKTFNL